MDFQNRPGGKTGGGGVASWSETNRDRRERLRQLALETIDLNKDPYFMKNHLGLYNCFDFKHYFRRIGFRMIHYISL